jgi:deoxyribodipyrimidine photolyase-related protein
MKSIKIIFPNQLFQDNPLLSFEGPIYLVEEFLFFKQYNFHKQKIAFHRASMKYYEDYLLKKGFQVNYIAAKSSLSDIRNLIDQLHLEGVEKITTVDTVDHWLSKRIDTTCKKLNIALEIVDSPLFLNTKEELNLFFKPNKKKYLQTEFYKQERIRRKILVTETDAAVGGQWTYDVENRKKFPKGKSLVKVEYPKENKYFKEAKAYTLQYFPNNVGSFSDTLNYPIGFNESEQWVQQFLEKRFAEFGDYEDAILLKETLLHHSLLTPMLNVGMLTPKQVLAHSIEFGESNEIPMNSLEGFIRQIMGWREFIRGIYLAQGTVQRTKNYWGFKRKIPKSFYDGSTGILPVDETIKKILNTGYCHHIERLMVLGNFMLLCEFDPDEVYRWFMEFFIDAYDWVMVPNVYGMSQFADGGLMATKPYISGSNYLMKMSDYPKGAWQETWDALFWRFMDEHRSFFLSNPRLGMLVKTFDKWDEEKKKSIHSRANKFLSAMEG